MSSYLLVVSEWEVLLSHLLPPQVDLSYGSINIPILQAGNGLCQELNSEVYVPYEKLSLWIIPALSSLSIFCF